MFVSLSNCNSEEECWNKHYYIRHVMYHYIKLHLLHIYVCYLIDNTVNATVAHLLSLILTLIFSCTLSRYHYLYPFMISFSIRHVTHHTLFVFLLLLSLINYLLQFAYIYCNLTLLFWSFLSSLQSSKLAANDPS